jgi:hypothetical protein
MPYYREMLASAWPDIPYDVGAPPIKFDAQFLAGLKATEFGLYGRNTRGLRRNQVEDTRNINKSNSSGLKAPKFLSEKARELATSALKSSDPDELISPLAEMEIESKKSEVPVMYRNVEIKYSKFGVDDFDFGSVSSTPRRKDTTNPAQLLQQNTVFWARDSHIELVCQLPPTNHALHSYHSKRRPSACLVCLHRRNLSPV